MTMERPEQLRKAGGRGNIQVHQATGMVVAQTGASVDEALSRMLGYATNAGASVQQVAADIIDRKISFS
jgi:AmiR/NasT family two-component response regulator